MTDPMPKRRIGRFWLSVMLIDLNPEMALAALDGCIVVRAEMRYDANSIEYIALAPGFDEVPVGFEVPLYEAVISGGKRDWLRMPSS